jgi:ACS family glucarate transporter-like MFS transporter
VSPSRARYITLAFAIALAVITYVDRVCISQAGLSIQKELGLSKIQWGWVLGVFAWAYALFEVPGGWLGDRIGPRRVLMRIVIWWSIFTAATGWAWNATSLIVTRALFGMGEAGCYPNLTRVFTTWLPTKERERAQAWLWLASRWSGAFTPLLVVSVLRLMSWRRAFEIFGAIGVIWAILFYRWYRDDPATHPRMNRAELALLPPASQTASVHDIPWRVLFARPAVWLLCAQYMCLSYGWYFYITWLPAYLRESRGTSVTLGAILAGLPLLLGGIGCMVSAALAPPLTRMTGSIITSRRIIAVTGFVGASASILVFTRIQNPVQAMFVLGLAGFFNDFVMPPAWAGCMDVGGRYSGTVSGTMNMMGNMAGAISASFIGYLLTWTANNWTLTFYISAAIYSLGAVFWLFLDAHTPLEQPAAMERAA